MKIIMNVMQTLKNLLHEEHLLYVFSVQRIVWMSAASFVALLSTSAI